MGTRELAVIDLGSNTLHLSLYAIEDGKYRHLYEYDESARLRLVDAIDAEGELSSTAIDAASNVLNDFRARCASAKVPVTNIVTVVTSALRGARNWADAVRHIEDVTKLKVRVLTEDDEARYACAAVTDALGMRNGLVFDLGGGGLRVAQVQEGAMVHAQGYMLGTLRLLRRFPNYAPMSAGQLDALRAFVASKFIGESWMRQSMGAGSMFAGIGGTVRALARIDQGATSQKSRVRGYELSAETLERWVQRLASMTVDELTTLPGLNSSRVDMALFGAIIVRELMSAAGARVLTVCDTSIREGVALGS
jgi:exopolyphosphatase/guanosine-5'-triphosphate,3'-diphosphate pyrophosphatase